MDRWSKGRMILLGNTAFCATVQIEKGTPTVAMGAYFQVSFVLGLEKDFLKLGADDELGRKIQVAGLLVKERAPKK